MSRTLRGVALMAALLLSAPTAFADRDIHESAQVHPKGEVEVSNIAGSVRVTGWDRDVVEVTGTLGSGVEDLEFRTEGRYTLIKVRMPRNGRSGGSDLEISMPASGRLTVGTVSSDTTVQGVQGALRLQTVSGKIETDVFGEDAQLKTVSGDVIVQGTDEVGLLTVTTVSGDVGLRDVRGEMVVQTVSGDVEAESTELERARIRTTNGDADLRTGLASGARVEMEAVNGDLTLTITGEPDAEFNIETFNGDIRNDFGPEPVRTSRYAPGRELRFSERDGSARVGIKTLNGAIILRTD